MVTVNIISIRKEASCNITFEPSFVPDVSSTATTQSGTTVIVASKEKGNIRATLRYVASSITPDFPEEEIPGLENYYLTESRINPKTQEIEQVWVDRTEIRTEE